MNKKEGAGFKFPVKSTIFTAIILLAVAAVVVYIWNTLINASYFDVREVMVKGGKADVLERLKGRNILTLDLDALSRELSRIYPEYSRILLVKVMPDRIFAEFVKRKPIAFVKLKKFYVLDEDGVLLDATGDPLESELPVVTGLENRISSIKPGRQYNVRDLNVALFILKEARSNKTLKDYKIKKIDVAVPSSTSLYIPLQYPVLDYQKGKNLSVIESVEIRIGQDNLRRKLSLLGDLFLSANANKDLVNIRYIDLRFKEPVIKFK